MAVASSYVYHKLDNSVLSGYFFRQTSYAYKSRLLGSTKIGQRNQFNQTKKKRLNEIKNHLIYSFSTIYTFTINHQKRQKD